MYLSTPPSHHKTVSDKISKKIFLEISSLIKRYFALFIKILMLSGII
jgi:hypothetical protein